MAHWTVRVRAALRSEPLFLSVLRDDESILEVAVHSSLEAEERADAFRDIVQQYLVTDEPTAVHPPPLLLHDVPVVWSAAPITTNDASTGELVMRCRAAVTCGEAERPSGLRYGV